MLLKFGIIELEFTRQYGCIKPILRSHGFTRSHESWMKSLSSSLSLPRKWVNVTCYTFHSPFALLLYCRILHWQCFFILPFAFVCITVVFTFSHFVSFVRSCTRISFSPYWFFLLYLCEFPKIARSSSRLFTLYWLVAMWMILATMGVQTRIMGWHDSEIWILGEQVRWYWRLEQYSTGVQSRMILITRGH